ncbi:Zinc finger, DPH-type [Ostreococcus tauri]|uniref:Diphthamide biosynthesis protein 3 n=1 Tax=Ostreococcus tauri TaxID=70448 RepID=A0A096PA56_OSTTA|nr:Zinc finger, DPH-type [Ostreococcus tauri]CEG01271.1 Zinc finger, DPH-type [Ostreococcus tauri]|eukprot:XP_022840871.1 Zinc finger, DPH-type [Ostreococcus tauri]
MTASTADVIDAYKRLALVRHPDRPNGSARAFLELKRARDVLSDRELRKLYDASLIARASRPTCETVDASDMEIVSVSFDSHDRGAGMGAFDCVRRSCQCGDAFEISSRELEALRRTHDECVLECGGCSLRIAVRLAPIGVELGEDVLEA